MLPKTLTPSVLFFLFFLNDTATTEIYTLSLHDALPILLRDVSRAVLPARIRSRTSAPSETRSEEHTSELQSRGHIVCRLLLEKNKKISRFTLSSTARCAWGRTWTPAPRRCCRRRCRARNACAFFSN